MTGNSFEQIRRPDHIDELAALFLTEPDSPASAQSVKEPAFRELLIVGNLPVRGGVWLTPYADAIARDNGPTALVRFDLKPPTLELLRAEELRFGPRSADPGAVETMSFTDAVLHAGAGVAVWIVRGPAEQPPADLIALGFDRITILTSANSAAVVAAYRIIKEIVAMAAEDGGRDLPPFALAIAGAGEQDAAEVVLRINETATAQLGVNVALACCLPRMDAGIRCQTFASFAESAAPTVADLLEWIDLAAGEEAWDCVEDATGAEDDDDVAVSSEKRDAERPALRLAPLVDEIGDAERDALLREEIPFEEAIDSDEAYETDDRLKDGQPDSAMIETILQEPVAEPSAEERKSMNGRVALAPKPATAVRRSPEVSDERTDLPSLASFVRGLEPLPLHCPSYEAVELATDDAGRVHVLAREILLRELRVVETWVRSHRRLLSMACPDRSINDGGDIVCHIFTDEPATLADLHGTGLRLHVVAPVTVGDETAWYSAPLSK